MSSRPDAGEHIRVFRLGPSADPPAAGFERATGPPRNAARGREDLTEVRPAGIGAQVVLERERR
jgi:hypothetical protein